MIKVLYQGAVQVTSEPYWVVGNDDIVGFHFDVDRRAWVDAISHNPHTGCPTVFLSADDESESTEVEFTTYPGWVYHSSSGGKTVTIALVKDKI